MKYLFLMRRLFLQAPLLLTCTHLLSISWHVKKSPESHRIWVFVVEVWFMSMTFFGLAKGFATEGSTKCFHKIYFPRYYSS